MLKPRRAREAGARAPSRSGGALPRASGEAVRPSDHKRMVSGSVSDDVSEKANYATGQPKSESSTGPASGGGGSDWSGLVATAASSPK